MRTGRQDILFHQYFLKDTTTAAANGTKRNVFAVFIGIMSVPVLDKWISRVQPGLRNHLSDNIHLTVYPLA